MTFHFGPCVSWNAGVAQGGTAQALAVGPSGEVYVCGYRGTGKQGSFVARYNPQGKMDWSRWHGGNELDQSVAIAVDGRGNAYVVDLAAGPTPDNPFMSLKRRLKRANFFLQRQRLVEEGKATPISRFAGLPERLVSAFRNTEDAFTSARHYQPA